MEHKHKALATASSQPQGASPGTIIDRFSDLPDEVAHHILSFLNFQDLTRVCSVTKRCGGLYLSTPSLKFAPTGETRPQLFNLLKTFDRFLIQRGDIKIRHFKISLTLHTTLRKEISRLISWVNIATRCNVEALDLYWYVVKAEKEMMEFPSCIIACRSLRSVSLEWYAVLKVPSVTGFSNLQHLKLKSVSIDEEFCKWIASTCKCIKEMQLDHVRAENITIESSSLESFTYECSYSELCHLKISGLKLERINIEWGFIKPGSRSLYIFTPNLKYFKWTGNLLNRQSLGDLICLEKAEIIWRPRYLLDNQNDFDNAVEFLSSIRRVKVLILSDKTTKALFKECSVSVPFDNVSYLGMHVNSLSDDLVPAMVSLLRGLSNLNTLRIEADVSSLVSHKPKACGFNRKYWKSQNLNFASHLKDVRIELSNGYNGMELARYIVEQSRSLERMVLFHLPKQKYVKKKVTQSKGVGRSRASIVFHERPLR